MANKYQNYRDKKPKHMELKLNANAQAKLTETPESFFK